MSSSTYSLCDQAFDNSAVTNNGVFTLFTSQTINNSVGLSCARIVIDYSNSNPIDPVGHTYGVTGILEGVQDGVWYPLAYQFESFRGTPFNGPQRVITIQPDIQSFDAGIDDNMWIGEYTTARISRQQGRVSGSIRFRLLLSERGFGTSTAFQAITVRAIMELYQ